VAELTVCSTEIRYSGDVNKGERDPIVFAQLLLFFERREGGQNTRDLGVIESTED